MNLGYLADCELAPKKLLSLFLAQVIVRGAGGEGFDVHKGERTAPRSFSNVTHTDLEVVKNTTVSQTLPALLLYYCTHNFNVFLFCIFFAALKLAN
jgi:hypothetical protein